MTNKEILLSAIKLKKVPRNSVITLSSGVWTYKQFGLSLQDAFTKPPENVADLIINSAEKIDSDVVWTAADCNNVILKALGAKTTFDIVGSPSSVDAPLINDINDIFNLNLSDIENSPEINNLLAVTRRLKGRIADKYLISVSQWGPLTLAGQMLGIEKLMRLIVRDKTSVNTLLSVTEKVILRYFELFKEAGAELFCIAEPSASGDMISRKVFEAVALPHLQGVYREIDAEAKMLHICGNTAKILDLIPLTGANLYSFDYKVSVSEAVDILGGKIAFAGQLDPVSVMLEGTPDEVHQTALACLEAAKNTNGFVLMPGCDLPPNTKIENVLSMVKAAHNTYKE